MTESTNPVPPQQPAEPIPVIPQAAPPPQMPPPQMPPPQMPAPQMPPARRSKTGAWAIGAVAAIVVLCCGGLGLAVLSDDEGEPSAASPSTAASSPAKAAPATGAPAAASTTDPPAPTYRTPTKSDFKLSVKILKKQCFGSAGCNVTYRIGVTYTGPGLDPYKTYEVTYAVKGAEDPIVNTLEVTGDSASVQQEEFTSTRRSSDKLTAVVTSVSEL